MTIVTVGPDIAKQIFQVHGLDRAGKVVLRKRLRRTEVSSFFAGVEPCLIGLEASGGAHYWFRVLSRLGHSVCLIAPQFVKPYVKLQKNDANDAAAICEAVSRPSMRFVPAKRVEQQDVQCLHWVCSRLIGAGHSWSIRFAGCWRSTGLFFRSMLLSCVVYGVSWRCKLLFVIMLATLLRHGSQVRILPRSPGLSRFRSPRGYGAKCS